MKTLSYFDVASQQVTTHGTNVLKIEGYFKGTTDSWLQVHDSATTPANAAVPLKQWFIGGETEFYKEFKNGELHITKGLYLAISTAEGTFTVSTETMDLSVELDKVEEPSGTSIAGDLTTDTAHLDIWSEASGPKHLIRLEVDASGAGADNFLQLFAREYANLTPTDVPVAQWTIKDGVAYTVAGSAPFDFGINGISPIWQKSGVNYYGCCVILSSTSGVPTIVVNPYKIKAEYK